jgi:transposase-like protein
MTKQCFTPEFKAEAIKQITERGYSVKEVSELRNTLRAFGLIYLKLHFCWVYNRWNTYTL